MSAPKNTATPAHLLPKNAPDGSTKGIIYGKTCRYCGGPLFVPKSGPLPTYCSASCRIKAHRNRTR